MIESARVQGEEGGRTILRTMMSLTLLSSACAVEMESRGGESMYDFCVARSVSLDEECGMQGEIGYHHFSDFLGE